MHPSDGMFLPNITAVHILAVYDSQRTDVDLPWRLREIKNRIKQVTTSRIYV